MASIKTIRLNVGGTIVQTGIEKMEKLGLSGIASRKASNDGAIFIDEDPSYFKVLLNWARSDVMDAPEEAITVNHLVATAKSLGVNENVMKAIYQYANHINNKAYIKELNNNLDYDEKNDINEPHVDLAHHNQIDVEYRFLRRGCLDQRFWHPVDISCCRYFSHIRGTPDISKFFIGCENKTFVYKYEMKNLRVECKRCHNHVPVKPNLGWCHKCQLCITCQNNGLCVSPESFNRIDIYH